MILNSVQVLMRCTPLKRTKGYRSRGNESREVMHDSFMRIALERD